MEIQNGAVAKSYKTNGLLNAQILGSLSSYKTLQLLHSEVPYIWGKFDFLFFQCALWFSFLSVHSFTYHVRHYWSFHSGLMHIQLWTMYDVEKKLTPGPILTMCLSCLSSFCFPCTVRALSVHFACAVRAQSMRWPCAVHALSVHCPCAVRALSVHCPCAVRALSVHCPCALCALSVRCLCDVCALSVHCSCAFRALSVHCPCTVRALLHCRARPCTVRARLCTVCALSVRCPCTVLALSVHCPCTFCALSPSHPSLCMPTEFIQVNNGCTGEVDTSPGSTPPHPVSVSNFWKNFPAKDFHWFWRWNFF